MRQGTPRRAARVIMQPGAHHPLLAGREGGTDHRDLNVTHSSHKLAIRDVLGHVCVGLNGVTC